MRGRGPVPSEGEGHDRDPCQCSTLSARTPHTPIPLLRPASMIPCNVLTTVARTPPSLPAPSLPVTFSITFSCTISPAPLAAESKLFKTCWTYVRYTSDGNSEIFLIIRKNIELRNRRKKYKKEKGRTKTDYVNKAFRGSKVEMS